MYGKTFPKWGGGQGAAAPSRGQYKHLYVVFL